MTIKQLKGAIEVLQNNIDHACREAEHNCQVCMFEGRCGDELEQYDIQLKEACCKAAQRDCSKCIYLKKCKSSRSFAEIKRRRQQQLLDDCEAVGSDCSKCKHFMKHCDLEKGHLKWLEYVDECCNEPYGCIKCPCSSFCLNEKAYHVLSLVEKLHDMKAI